MDFFYFKWFIWYMEFFNKIRGEDRQRFQQAWLDLGKRRLGVKSEVSSERWNMVKYKGSWLFSCLGHFFEDGFYILYVTQLYGDYSQP